jgi:hypothetical protein
MIIYSKYNNSRKPDFTLETLIDKTDDKLSVIKRAVTPAAEKFADSFFDKYEYLIKNNFPFQISQPHKIENGIAFDFVSNHSMDGDLARAVLEGDKMKIKSIFTDYKNIVDQIDQINTETGDEFDKIFGDSLSKDPYH